MTRTMIFLASAVAATALVVLTSGCCSSGFGESVKVSVERTGGLSAAPVSAKPLRLPADGDFVITECQRHSTGSGQANSEVRSSGTAHSSAESGSEGSAWAEFQLGHVLYNDTDKPRKVTILADVLFEYGMGTSGQLVRNPDMCALKLYVQDSNRKMIKKAMLLQQSDSPGADKGTVRQTPSFDVDLEPGLSYQIVLAGRVEVDGDSGQTAAQIDVKNFKIEVYGH